MMRINGLLQHIFALFHQNVARDEKNIPLGFDSVELIDRPWFPYLCTEVEFWQWKTAGDDHFNLWMALTGDGYLTCDRETFRIRPGSFFVFSPHQTISAAHCKGPRITRFSAHFFPTKEGDPIQHVEGLPLLGGKVENLATVQRQIDAIMRIALRREDDTALAGRIHNLIVQVCSGKDPQPSSSLSPRVTEALRVFREDPASVHSIDAFASRLGASRSHFDREFTNQVGQPPRQFLINCKMIEARRYLESSHLRVGEIAEALGYKDIYFFSRQFKQLVGVSARDYRKGLQGSLLQT
jgi:AraC-like DNA-binding protein